MAKALVVVVGVVGDVVVVYGCAFFFGGGGSAETKSRVCYCNSDKSGFIPHQRNIFTVCMI
jgi:hypothetical protein